MKKKYIKSPLNYVGGKHKLLPQIEPLFPKTKIFVDLFGGGCNVAVNAEAEKVIYNELCPNVYGIVKGIKEDSGNIEYFNRKIEQYNLTKENEDGYRAFRDYYNNNHSKYWRDLYILICYSFNNQIRFNQQGGYNMPFGKNRSSFNPTLQGKFLEFEAAIKGKNITLFNKDFRELLKSEKINEDYFFYCDPPYLITTAAYNENGGWREVDEIELLNLLDKVDSKGGKFALSNVIEHKGRSNDILKKWSEKYNVHYLNYDYKNCNYQSKDSGKTIEVLITNY